MGLWNSETEQFMSHEIMSNIVDSATIGRLLLRNSKITGHSFSSSSAKKERKGGLVSFTATKILASAKCIK